MGKGGLSSGDEARHEGVRLVAVGAGRELPRGGVQQRCVERGGAGGVVVRKQEGRCADGRGWPWVGMVVGVGYCRVETKEGEGAGGGVSLGRRRGWLSSVEQEEKGSKGRGFRDLRGWGGWVAVGRRRKQGLLACLHEGKEMSKGWWFVLS